MQIPSEPAVEVGTCNGIAIAPSHKRFASYHHVGLRNWHLSLITGSKYHDTH